jgi:hypothetical protein
VAKQEASGREIIRDTITAPDTFTLAAALHGLEAPHIKAMRAIEKHARSRGVRGHPAPPLVLHAVLATLKRHGLIRNMEDDTVSKGEDRHYLTEFGTQMLELLRDAADTYQGG